MATPLRGACDSNVSAHARNIFTIARAVNMARRAQQHKQRRCARGAFGWQKQQKISAAIINALVRVA